jgi:hypothetical protein
MRAYAHRKNVKNWERSRGATLAERKIIHLYIATPNSA